MLPVQGETEYTPVNSNNEPICNMNSNGSEYYLSSEKSGKILKNAASIPFLFSSIGSTSFMALIFGAIALGIRYGGKEKKATGVVITLVVFFVLFLISMTTSIVIMRLNVKSITDTSQGERPCYSTKENKVIEKD
jgi:hypothetical protein